MSVPDLGVDPTLILNPAYRQYFGRESSNIFTSYGLLLRVLCKMFYRKQIQEIEKREKTKNSRTRMQKNVIRLTEWEKYFKKAIYDLTKAGEKMLSLDSVPSPDESPESAIVSLRGSGKDALKRYKDKERLRMKVWVDLMEKHLDELWKASRA